MGDVHDEDNETRADNVFGTFGLAGSLAFAMREWLVRDLASVDRSKTPWVIVMFHVPWYNSNQGHYKEAERHRWGLEKVLYDAGVDVILNGHVHSYERSSWVYDWRPDACGPTHLVVGDGGNYEGPYGGSWRTPQPDWSKFREGSFGAGRLTIYNETAARWRWHRTTCVEGKYFPITTFRRLIAHTILTLSFLSQAQAPRSCTTIPTSHQPEPTASTASRPTTSQRKPWRRWTRLFSFETC